MLCFVGRRRSYLLLSADMSKEKQKTCLLHLFDRSEPPKGSRSVCFLAKHTCGESKYLAIYSISQSNKLLKLVIWLIIQWIFPSLTVEFIVWLKKQSVTAFSQARWGPGCPPWAGGTRALAKMLWQIVFQSNDEFNSKWEKSPLKIQPND